MRLWEILKRHIVGRRYGASKVDSIKLLGYECRDYSNPVSEEDRKKLAAFESSLLRSFRHTDHEESKSGSVTDQALAGVIQRYMNNDGAGTAKDIVDGSNCGIEPGRHSAYKD